MTVFSRLELPVRVFAKLGRLGTDDAVLFSRDVVAVRGLDAEEALFPQLEDERLRWRTAASDASVAVHAPILAVGTWSTQTRVLDMCIVYTTIGILTMQKYTLSFSYHGLSRWNLYKYILMQLASLF